MFFMIFMFFMSTLKVTCYKLNLLVCACNSSFWEADTGLQHL